MSVKPLALAFGRRLAVLRLCRAPGRDSFAQAERTIVVPGTAFGIPGHLRLSMAAPDEAVDGALAAFRKVCG